MKKSKFLVFSSLFFLTMLFAEIYCFIEFRQDLVTVIGVGAVLLIAAFLMIDSLLSLTKNEPAEKEMPLIPQDQEDTDRIQKAMYMLHKRGYAAVEERLMSLEDTIGRNFEALSTEILNAAKIEVKYGRENAKQIIINNKKKIDQAIAQSEFYTKEVTKLAKDMEGRITSSDRPLDKISLSDDSVLLFTQKMDNILAEVKEYRQSVEGIRQQMGVIQDAIGHMEIKKEDAAASNILQSPEDTAAVLTASLDDMPEQPFELQMDAEADEIITTEKEPTGELGSDNPEEKEFDIEQDILLMQEEVNNIMEEPVSEPGAPEVTETAAEPERKIQSATQIMEPKSEASPAPAGGKMSQDDIASMIAAMGNTNTEAAAAAEKTPEAPPKSVPTAPAPSSNAAMSQDDIASLIASIGGSTSAPEPIPEPDPVPMPVSNDPNKALSADEIAALFASLGQ